MTAHEPAEGRLRRGRCWQRCTMTRRSHPRPRPAGQAGQASVEYLGLVAAVAPGLIERSEGALVLRLRFRENVKDEIGLCSRVCVAVMFKLGRKLVLESRIFFGHARMCAQVVAKGELRSKARRVGRDQMQVMRPAGWAWLAEPQHFIGSVGRIHVFEFSERPDVGMPALQATDADEDVDDGLGIQPRN